MEYDISALYDLVHLYEGSVVRSRAEGAGNWQNRKKKNIKERTSGAHWMGGFGGLTVGLDGF